MFAGDGIRSHPPRLSLRFEAYVERIRERFRYAELRRLLMGWIEKKVDRRRNNDAGKKQLAAIANIRPRAGADRTGDQHHKHYGAYLQEQHLQKTGGPFVPIITEYLEGFAAIHYRETFTVRRSIAPFFEYLQTQGITSLDDVTPKTVTAYLAWGESMGTVASPILLHSFLHSSSGQLRLAIARVVTRLCL